MSKRLIRTPLSVLDFASYSQGQSVADGLANSQDLARHAEDLGYKRYWLAEHHNAEGIGSAATAVLIGLIASGTRRIRVGAGGVMLPNHSPYVIAEQFGTLDAVFPDRIDLGLGRAPGTDQMTAHALRSHWDSVPNFEALVEELSMWLSSPSDTQRVKAIPGAGTDVPIWILGSSANSGKLAAALGRPYAFAGHFAPGAMLEALEAYRKNFQPSRHLTNPHVMIGAAVVAAEDDAKARYLASSMYQRFARVVQGIVAPLPPPVEELNLSEPVRRAVDSLVSEMVVGGPDTVAKGLESLIERTGADELIISSDLYAHADRRRSYEITAIVAGLSVPISLL